MFKGATLPKEEVPQVRGGRVAGTETSTMRLLPCRNHCLEAWVLLLLCSLAYRNGDGMEMVDDVFLFGPQHLVFSPMSFNMHEHH